MCRVKIDIVDVKVIRFGFVLPVRSSWLKFLSCYSMFSVPVVRIKVLNNKKINMPVTGMLSFPLNSSLGRCLTKRKFSRPYKEHNFEPC